MDSKTQQTVIILALIAAAIALILTGHGNEAFLAGVALFFFLIA